MRRLNLSLKSVILFIAFGILLPVMLSTVVGIVALATAENAAGLVTGILIISFAATATGCAVAAVALAGSKARMATRQADFMANVSHEFRTPLSAIRLYAQMLESGTLSDKPGETARCAATIVRETEWLDMMIDRVLTWRASSKNMVVLKMKSASVTDAVTSAVSRFSTMVLPDEVKLQSSINSEAIVRHDPNALTAVMLNLLTNAYKYTGQDKHIRVSVTDEGGDVTIEVIDNGIGISQAEIKRIFDPFYRARGDDAASAGGVGLGLAIAKHIVDQHGGTIAVDSEKEQGTTFRISLPVEEPSSEH